MKKSGRPVNRGVSDALLAAALRAQDEGVFVARQTRLRPGWEIVFANENFCAMIGYTAEELHSRSPGLFHAHETDSAKIEHWGRSARNRRPLTGEDYLVRKDGTTLHASWNLSVIPAARGHAVHIVAAYRDTTTKRRLQEALMHSQRLDAVGRLAGGVAHDFNNLLAVINGYCQILASQLAGQSRLLQEVEEIHQAGEKAAVLTRQLLAFGRRQPLEVRVVNLNRFVNSNADILARLLGDAGRLELDLDPAIRQVCIDPAQFQQVLLNLTLNARDALRKDGRVVIATSRCKISSALNRRFTDVKPGAYVCLSVSDNGTGMNAATQKQLFEPFFTTKPEGKGSGLGLSLVHGVVQQSGGFITVESEPSKGSIFEILLPETRRREEAPAPRPTIETLPATRGHEMVLLVEEDDVVRKMVTGILTADGYRVVAVKTAVEGRRAARHLPQPVQLLIASLSGDGEPLARALHAVEPSLRVLSTTPRNADVSLAWLKRRRRAQLPKPYALSELLKAARALLDA